MHERNAWGLAVAVAIATLAAGCGAARGREAEAPALVNVSATSTMVSAPSGGAQRLQSVRRTAGYEVLEAVAAETPAPAMAPGGAQARPGQAAPSVADVPHSSALLIYTADLAMAVFQVEPSLDAVERIGRDEGGYLSARQDRAITIRVPRDRFDDALAKIDHLGDVTHREIKAQDVTDEFVDLEARLRNARAMRDRLADLLTRANVKEALDIERELGRITEEIERFEGRLKLLRDEIAFSTISVSFAPVAEQVVHDTSLLSAIPWLQDLGLRTLLQVQR